MNAKVTSPSLKLMFGPPPATFEKDVEHTFLDGSKIKFKVKFKYRNRTQYGELMDELTKKGKVVTADLSTKDYMGMKVSADAEGILAIAEGWSLDDPFTLEQLNFMSDNHPAVMYAISEAYREAVLEGRLKN